MKMRKEIPTNANGWIEYHGNCYIIELDDNAPQGRFNSQGIMSVDNTVKGWIVAEINNSFKWFDKNWWYSLYRLGNGVRTYEFVKGLKPYEVQWSYYDILKAIIKEVERCTGLVFNNINENTHWSEGSIYLNSKGKYYLITWENCD